MKDFDFSKMTVYVSSYSQSINSAILHDCNCDCDSGDNDPAGSCCDSDNY